MRRAAILLCVLGSVVLGLIAGCREKQAAAPEPATPPSETVEKAPPGVPPAGPGDPFAQQKSVKLAEVLPDLKGTDPGKRMNAISSLARVAGEKDREEALRILMQMFDTDKDPNVRGAVLGSMHAYPLKKTKAYLIRATRDPIPSVRQSAVSGLARSADPDAAAVLMEAMKDASAEVRYNAVQAYCQAAKGQGEPGLRKLIAALGSENSELRAQATMALVARGREAVPSLMDAAGAGPWYARAAAVTALGLVAGGTSARQAQWAKQVASDFDAQPEAMPPDSRATPVLAKALKDPDFRVRLAAAQGLGLQGTTEAARACAASAKDPNVEVRRRAASALTVLPPEGVQGGIVEMLRDPDADVRRYAVEAVAGLPADVAVPALIEFVGTETEPRALEEACDRLGGFRDQRATDPLIRLFDNENADVRWAAVRAVGKFEDPRAIAALRKALKDRTPWVAFSAEQALHKLRIQESAPRGIPEEGQQ